MMLKRRKAPKMGVRASPWWRSESFKQFVRGFKCAVEGNLDPCDGPIQFAHVRNETDGAGSKKPSDWWGIPLCMRHHMHIQTPEGEPAFERKYGIDMKAEAIKLWNLWPKRFQFPGMGPKLNPWNPHHTGE